ncbi:MAG: hypothetical protein KAI81_00210 [Candidatus Marinimicrobia bacterium]|nr:hypothetical protein [Candidatus Neomarinimicrobiota bacterium]
MYALDTNILVYAHNSASPLHVPAKSFVERKMNTFDDNGNLSICIPAQVLMEFMNVITWQRLEVPLTLAEAMKVVQGYMKTRITLVYPQPTQLDTLMSLLNQCTSRKKIFDIALAATLKDNWITGLYTVNVKDFKGLSFLDIKNPL